MKYHYWKWCFDTKEPQPCNDAVVRFTRQHHNKHTDRGIMGSHCHPTFQCAVFEISTVRGLRISAESCQLRAHLKPLCTILPWCTEGFKGLFIMPRGVSIWGSCTPDNCINSTLAHNVLVVWFIKTLNPFSYDIHIRLSCCRYKQRSGSYSYSPHHWKWKIKRGLIRHLKLKLC